MADEDIIDTIGAVLETRFDLAYEGVDGHQSWETSSVARDALAALHAAGYAIVELPEPADGEWVIQGIGNVATYAWDGSPLPPGGVRVTNIGYDLELHALKARELAAALLASADKAEETGRGRLSKLFAEDTDGWHVTAQDTIAKPLPRHP